MARGNPRIINFAHFFFRKRHHLEYLERAPKRNTRTHLSSLQYTNTKLNHCNTEREKRGKRWDITVITIFFSLSAHSLASSPSSSFRLPFLAPSFYKYSCRCPYTAREKKKKIKEESFSAFMGNGVFFFFVEIARHCVNATGVLLRRKRRRNSIVGTDDARKFSFLK